MIPNNISVYFASNVGNSRPIQEDNAILPNGFLLTADLAKAISEGRNTYGVAFNGNCGGRFLVAVSDGMGGHARGEVASYLAVAHLSSHHDEIINSVKDGERAFGTQISRINGVVTSASKKDSSCKGMGATLCGLAANGSELLGFNIGDSRLYRLKNGSLTQISVDHTEGQRLLRMKLLTEDEVKNFARRKVLHKYLGYDGEIIPDVFRITDAERGDLFLLCSDGLTDVMSDMEIEQVLKDSTDLEYKAKRLVNEAVSRNVGHGDNTTVILVEI